METFEIALTMITKDMFMCSLDIRHAYYSVPVAREHRKYLRFVWKEQIPCLSKLKNWWSLD